MEKKKWYKKWWVWLIAIIVLIMGFIGYEEPQTIKDNNTVSETTSIVEEPAEDGTKETEEEVVPSIMETPSKETTTSKPNNNNNNEVKAEYVYITNSGQKYHLEFCRSLKSSKIVKNKQDAIEEGYSPCKLCNP